MSKAHRFKDKIRTDDVLISESVDFSGLLLSKHVLKGLTEAGFKRPSPIQLKAIPLGRCGLDLIVQAKSGTGKTCVFTVVALESLEIKSLCVQVLVLAPTREIALQIQDVIQTIGAATKGLKCASFIGGMPLDDDKYLLRSCHIAVGTPGRIKHLIQLEALKTNNIRLFVMDEADKLLEGDFKESINWIYSALPPNKQILALSATYPEHLAQLLTSYMRNPTFVRLNTTDPALIGIKQYHIVIPDHPIPNKVFQLKTEAVVNILSSVSFQQCLIFSNFQTRAQNLQSELQSRNWPTVCIAGSLDQKERNLAMEQLKTYKCRILISTDLTSRGIDAEKVNLVINLDVPLDFETYLHRIGRAGRFGSFGATVTIVTKGKEDKQLWAVEKKCNTYIHKLPDPIPTDLVTLPLPVRIDDIVITQQIINQPTAGDIYTDQTSVNADSASQETCLAPSARNGTCLSASASQETYLAPNASQETCLAPSACNGTCLPASANQEKSSPSSTNQEISLPLSACQEMCLPPSASQEACLPPSASQETCSPLSTCQETCLPPSASQESFLLSTASQESFLLSTASQEISSSLTVQIHEHTPEVPSYESLCIDEQLRTVLHNKVLTNEFIPQTQTLDPVLSVSYKSKPQSSKEIDCSVSQEACVTDNDGNCLDILPVHEVNLENHSANQQKLTIQTESSHKQEKNTHSFYSEEGKFLETSLGESFLVEDCVRGNKSQNMFKNVPTPVETPDEKLIVDLQGIVNDNSASKPFSKEKDPLVGKMNSEKSAPVSVACEIDSSLSYNHEGHISNGIKVCQEDIPDVNYHMDVIGVKNYKDACFMNNGVHKTLKESPNIREELKKDFAADQHSVRTVSELGENHVQVKESYMCNNVEKFSKCIGENHVQVKKSSVCNNVEKLSKCTKNKASETPTHAEAEHEGKHLLLNNTYQTSSLTNGILEVSGPAVSLHTCNGLPTKTTIRPVIELSECSLDESSTPSANHITNGGLKLSSALQPLLSTGASMESTHSVYATVPALVGPKFISESKINPTQEQPKPFRRRRQIKSFALTDFLQSMNEDLSLFKSLKVNCSSDEAVVSIGEKDNLTPPVDTSPRTGVTPDAVITAETRNEHWVVAKKSLDASRNSPKETVDSLVAPIDFNGYPGSSREGCVQEKIADCPIEGPAHIAASSLVKEHGQPAVTLHSQKVSSEQPTDSRYDKSCGTHQAGVCSGENNSLPNTPPVIRNSPLNESKETADSNVAADDSVSSSADDQLEVKLSLSPLVFTMQENNLYLASLDSLLSPSHQESIPHRLTDLEKEHHTFCQALDKEPTPTPFVSLPLLSSIPRTGCADVEQLQQACHSATSTLLAQISSFHTRLELAKKNKSIDLFAIQQKTKLETNLAKLKEEKNSSEVPAQFGQQGSTWGSFSKKAKGKRSKKKKRKGSQGNWRSQMYENSEADENTSNLSPYKEVESDWRQRQRNQPQPHTSHEDRNEARDLQVKSKGDICTRKSLVEIEKPVLDQLTYDKQGERLSTIQDSAEVNIIERKPEACPADNCNEVSQNTPGKQVEYSDECKMLDDMHEQMLIRRKARKLQKANTNSKVPEIVSSFPNIENPEVVPSLTNIENPKVVSSFTNIENPEVVSSLTNIENPEVVPSLLKIESPEVASHPLGVDVCVDDQNGEYTKVTSAVKDSLRCYQEINAKSTANRNYLAKESCITQVQPADPGTSRLLADSLFHPVTEELNQIDNRIDCNRLAEGDGDLRNRTYKYSAALSKRPVKPSKTAARLAGLEVSSGSTSSTSGLILSSGSDISDVTSSDWPRPKRALPSESFTGIIKHNRSSGTTDRRKLSESNLTALTTFNQHFHDDYIPQKKGTSINPKKSVSSHNVVYDNSLQNAAEPHSTENNRGRLAKASKHPPLSPADDKLEHRRHFRGKTSNRFYESQTADSRKLREMKKNKEKKVHKQYSHETDSEEYQEESYTSNEKNLSGQSLQPVPGSATHGYPWYSQCGWPHPYHLYSYPPLNSSCGSPYAPLHPYWSAYGHNYSPYSQYPPWWYPHVQWESSCKMWDYVRYMTKNLSMLYKRLDVYRNEQ